MPRSSIPGYEEALREERRLREEIFLGVNNRICGIEIKEVTPFLLARLCRMGTPFIMGGKCNVAEINKFLWALSPLFSADVSSRDKFVADATRLLCERWSEAEDEIDAFIKATFLDAPSGSSESIPYVSGVAWMIFRMSCDPFRWTRERTLHTPVREIYQLMRCSRIDQGLPLNNFLSDPIIIQHQSNLRDEWERNKAKGNN